MRIIRKFRVGFSWGLKGVGTGNWSLLTCLTVLTQNPGNYFLYQGCVLILGGRDYP